MNSPIALTFPSKAAKNWEGRNFCVTVGAGKK
jgi:hypothetical protein